jgi:hypothetical protein
MLDCMLHVLLHLLDVKTASGQSHHTSLFMASHLVMERVQFYNKVVIHELFYEK